MKSFPKPEYWHFKIPWKHCQENFQFSRRDFFWPPRFWYLDEILLDVLTRFSARFWPPRLWDLAKILLEFLSRFLASLWPPRFWDLVEISARILTRFWDLGQNLGEFLAAEILRSCQDLVEILDEILRSRRVFGRQDLAEISPRSWQSRRPKTCQDSRQEISPRSRSKFCRGPVRSWCHYFGWPQVQPPLRKHSLVL